jgi:hypothetical protein
LTIIYIFSALLLVEEVFIQKKEQELHNDGIDQRELLEVVSATTNKLSDNDSLKEEEGAFWNI